MREMRRRPERYDVMLHHNAHAYASFTRIGNEWMAGLFAAKNLQRGDLIAQYTGRIMTRDESQHVENQQYMFSARLVSDLRKRVVVDGNVNLYDNLAGYANYAQGSHANALFVDEARNASDDQVTSVVLRAGEAIPQGVEIRVDYDNDSSVNPFRDQLLAQGVPPEALRSSEYKRVRWVRPQAPVAHATLLSSSSPRHDLPMAHAHRIVASPRTPPRSPPRTSPRSPKTPTHKRPRGRPPKGHVYDYALGRYVRQ